MKISISVANTVNISHYQLIHNPGSGYWHVVIAWFNRMVKRTRYNTYRAVVSSSITTPFRRQSANEVRKLFNSLLVSWFGMIRNSIYCLRLVGEVRLLNTIDSFALGVVFDYMFNYNKRTQWILIIIIPYNQFFD